MASRGYEWEGQTDSATTQTRQVEAVGKAVAEQNRNCGFLGSVRSMEEQDGRMTFEEQRAAGLLNHEAKLERIETGAAGMLLTMLFVSLQDVFKRKPLVP